MAITYKKISELGAGITYSPTTDYFPISVYDGVAFTTKKFTPAQVLSASVDNDTIDVSSNKIRIKPASIDYEQIRDGGISADKLYLGNGLSAALGNALTLKIGSGLAMAGDTLTAPGGGTSYGYDGVTISANISNALFVKDGGITNTQLATGIDASKITTGTLPVAVIGSASLDATKIAVSATNTALSNVGSNRLGVNVDNSTIKINPSNQLYVNSVPTNLVAPALTGGTYNLNSYPSNTVFYTSGQITGTVDFNFDGVTIGNEYEIWWDNITRSSGTYDFKIYSSTLTSSRKIVVIVDGASDIICSSNHGILFDFASVAPNNNIYAKIICVGSEKLMIKSGTYWNVY